MARSDFLNIGSGSPRSRAALMGMNADANEGDRDALAELIKTIDTKQKGSGITGFLKDAAGDVFDVAGRGLDLLSRGQYASAEGVNRLMSLVEGEETTPQGAPSENLGDILEGLIGGIAGKNKTSYIDTLKGSESLQAVTGIDKVPFGEEILGFGLDVVADPLSWIGVGTIPKVIKGAGHVTDVAKIGGKSSKLLGKAAEGTEEALRKGIWDEVNAPANVMKREGYLTDDFMEGVAGEDVWRGMSTKEKQALRKKTRHELIQQDYDEVEAVMQAERATSKPPLAIKFGWMGNGRMGAVEIPGTAGIPDAISGLVGKVPVVAHASRLFRTDIAHGTAYQQMGRVVESANAGEFEVSARLFRQNMDNVLNGMGKKKLTTDDQELISRAIDTGLSTGDNDLDVVAETVRGYFKRIEDAEVEAGLLKADEVLENYFPYYYKKVPAEKTRRSVRAQRVNKIGRPQPLAQVRAGEAPSATLKDAFIDAKKVGLDPVTNLDEVITRRLGEHYEAMARYQFLSGIKNNFAVNIPTRLNPVTGKREIVGRIQKDKRALLKQQGYKDLRTIWSDKTGDLHRYVGNLTDDAEVFVPPETVDALESLRSIALTDEDAAYFGKLHRSVLNAVKSSMTIWNPAFHLRNFRGDIQLNWLDGMGPETIPLYARAASILEADLHRTMSDEIGGLLGTSAKLAKKKIRINKNLTLTGEQLMDLFRMHGGKSGFISYEAPTKAAKTPIGKTTNKLRTASEFREDIPRLAHFIHVLKEDKLATSAFDLMDKAAEAGARVRKFNIDYGDLTDFEKKLKNVIPFYTWFRKNIPLQMEAAFTRPGTQAVYAKAYNLVDEIYGPDSETVIPKWIGDVSSVEVRRTGMNKYLAAALGTVVPGLGGTAIPGEDPLFLSGNSIPLIHALTSLKPVAELAAPVLEGKMPDFGAAMQSGADIGMDLLSPLVTLLPELAAGRSSFTGGTQSPFEPFKEMFPQLDYTSQIPGTLQGDPLATQQLLNRITGTDINVNTSQRQQSELRRREDILDSYIRVLRESMGEDVYEEYKDQNLRQYEQDEVLNRLLGRSGIRRE